MLVFLYSYKDPNECLIYRSLLSPEQISNEQNITDFVFFPPSSLAEKYRTAFQHEREQLMTKYFLGQLCSLPRSWGTGCQVEMTNGLKLCMVCGLCEYNVFNTGSGNFRQTYWSDLSQMSSGHANYGSFPGEITNREGSEFKDRTKKKMGETWENRECCS